jgi:hypothetical protein
LHQNAIKGTSKPLQALPDFSATFSQNSLFSIPGLRRSRWVSLPDGVTVTAALVLNRQEQLPTELL